MGKLFDPESSIMQGLSKAADLIILNLLTLLCAVPVVTLGAAAAALHDSVGRMLREEGGGVLKTYVSAFRSNFKKATVLWLILLACLLLLAFSALFYLQNAIPGGRILLTLCTAFFILWNMALVWVFPLQARFENTVKNTLKNALLCAIAYLPRTVAAAGLKLLPWALLFYRTDLFIRIGYVWLLIWFALAAWLTAQLLKKPLQKLESAE